MPNGTPHSCNTWPFPSSDLDLVLPEDNAKVHIARGCCAASQTSTPVDDVPADRAASPSAPVGEP